MRLYLSSLGVGDEPHRLLALLRHPRHATVIANALDGESDEVRCRAVAREMAALAALGIDGEELDLRAYLQNEPGLAARLARHELLWVRGGNCFVLRHALAASGAATIVEDLLARDELVYGGYSAGVCVLGPSLRGLEAVDDAHAVERVYGRPAGFEGMAILEYTVVPHCQSTHPASEDLDAVAARYRRDGVPHRALRDGEAIVIDGAHNPVPTVAPLAVVHERPGTSIGTLIGPSMTNP